MRDIIPTKADHEAAAERTNEAAARILAEIAAMKAAGAHSVPTSALSYRFQNSNRSGGGL